MLTHFWTCIKPSYIYSRIPAEGSLGRRIRSSNDHPPFYHTHSPSRARSRNRLRSFVHSRSATGDYWLSGRSPCSRLQEQHTTSPLIPPDPTMSSYSDLPTSPQSPGSMSSRRLTNRNTNRYSVTALFSMAAEQDVEVEDELGRGA